MPLTVHHLGHSQSERIVWLCEELSIPYTLTKHDRAPLFSGPEYKALHPIAGAPVITDDTTTTTTPITLAESEACVEYIVHIHGSSRLTIPPSAPADKYADFLYWYHFPNGTFQPSISRLMTLKFAQVPADNTVFANYRERLHKQLSVIDQRVSANRWLAGDEFSVADVMIVFSLTTMREFYAYDLTGYEGILGYLERVGEREGYRRAMEKGDADVDWRRNMRGEAPEGFRGPPGHAK